MKARGIAAVLAATVVLGAMALPSAASAVRTHHWPATTSANLELHGTHGFRLSLFLSENGSSSVFASKRLPRFGNETASYFTPAESPHSKPNLTRLNLRVGRLGHFRGRFVTSSTKTEKPLGGCTGEPIKVEEGRFVGSFDFHGERGYTTVRARSARGTVTRQAAMRCRFPWERESPREINEAKEEKEREIRLIAGNVRKHLVLLASREMLSVPEPGSPTVMVIDPGGRAGRFLISRSAFYVGLGARPNQILQVPNLAEPFVETNLKPPAPFSGSATFHLDSPKAATWTGDLAVELPGLGKVPLTGDGIDAGMRAGLDRTETLPKALTPALEAGGRDIIQVSAGSGGFR